MRSQAGSSDKAAPDRRLHHRHYKASTKSGPPPQKVNNHGENLRKLPQIGNVQAQRQRLPQLAAEKKETPKVTPEEYAAAHVMSRIEWRTKRDSVENADGSKTVLEHHYPVVIVGEGDRRTVCGYYAYLSRDEMRYCAMSDEWKGTTTVVDEYMPHDGGFAIIRAMEEG